MSPYLFVIFLSVLMHDVECRFEKENGYIPNAFASDTKLWDLEYADDTVILAILL